MSMDEHQKGIQMGLRAAAQFLESEADDVERARAGQYAVMTAKEFAAWIRAVAEHVRQLRVTRGR